MEIETLPIRESNIEHIYAQKSAWFRCQLTAWAIQHLRDFPWRRTLDPYAIFIAEFLLQKTGAATVAPVYKAFLSKYPTLKALAIAPVEEVACLLQPLGLQCPSRATVPVSTNINRVL